MRFMPVAAAAALLVLATPASAATMSVATFVTKAEALKKKGPLALFSGDLKLLVNQVKADSAKLRAENQALVAGGKQKAYCTPADFKMDEDEIMRVMTSVPAPSRSATSTKQALKEHLARRFPCRS